MKDAISRPCPHFDQEKHKEDGEASYNGLRMTSSRNYNAGNITKAAFPVRELKDFVKFSSKEK